MKLALILVTAVLLLSACNANKTTATNAAQDTSTTSGSKLKQKSSQEKVGPSAKRSAPSAATLVENERGGDPNKSALNAQIHQ